MRPVLRTPWTIVAASLILFATTPGMTFAQSQNLNDSYGAIGNDQISQGTRPARAPGVFGTVTAIDGSSITVQSRGFGQNAQQTTYAIDASSATITKNNATASLSNIAVGDTVMIQGTITGTNVAAATIRDGMPERGAGGTQDSSATQDPSPADTAQPAQDTPQTQSADTQTSDNTQANGPAQSTDVQTYGPPVDTGSTDSAHATSSVDALTQLEQIANAPDDSQTQQPGDQPADPFTVSTTTDNSPQDGFAASRALIQQGSLVFTNFFATMWNLMNSVFSMFTPAQS